MAFPAEEHRIFVLGDVLEPDEVNDIEAAIVRMAGLGQFDVPIVPNAGIDLAAGESIRLAAGPRTQLYFEAVEEIVIPAHSMQWTPADDADVFLDGSGGAGGGLLSFTGVGRVMAGIILPRGVFVTQISLLYRRHASDTFTAVFRGRNPIGAAITDHATEVTPTGAASDQFLVLTPAAPVEIESGFMYWLSMLSSGSGPGIYSAMVKFNRPAP